VKSEHEALKVFVSQGGIGVVVAAGAFFAVTVIIPHSQLILYRSILISENPSE
jgi:hypothetical protein